MSARGEELFGISLLLGAALVLGALWLAAAFSGLLFGAGWSPTGFVDLLGVVPRLPNHASDPARAWPSGSRSTLPGPFGFYATLGLILTVGAATAVGLSQAAMARLRRRSRPPSARWARWGDLRALRVRHPRPRRLTLGRQGGTLIAAETLQSAIVIAPTQSGKTTGLAVPALLEWPGPVVATSIKTDLLNDTVARRRRLGEVMIYDPTEATRMRRIQASPLTGCGTWRGAMRVAHWLTTSARDGSGGLESADFWYSAAEKLLTPLLYAAGANALPMADVIRWLDSGSDTEPEVTDLLEQTGPVEALIAWQATWNRDQRQRSSIYTTAETVLAAFADPRVLASTVEPDYTPARLLDGRSNTLYLCAPAHEQERLRPLFSMMLREILAVIYESASASGEPLDPPLLMVLDEAANVAPIPNLDEVASSGAGQGLQLLTIFQDVAQIRQRYGPDRAETIVNNHRAKLFGSGISDPRTLEYVQRVIGAGEFREISETTGEPGRGSRTEATTFRELAPASVVRQARPGTALLIYGRLPPAKMRLRPWFADRRLRSLSAANDEGVRV
jgi:type IV secretion system protein VirD4